MLYDLAFEMISILFKNIQRYVFVSKPYSTFVLSRFVTVQNFIYYLCVCDYDAHECFVRSFFL